MKMDVQPISPIPMAKYPFSLAKMIDSDLRSDQQNADEFKDAGWICKVHRLKQPVSDFTNSDFPAELVRIESASTRDSF